MVCIGLEIEENASALDGFNAQAKQQLIEEVKSFTLNVIMETQRLEGFHNPTGSTPEITSTMVKDASTFVKGPHRIRKLGYKTIIIKSSSILFPLLTSILFDKSKLQDPMYLCLIGVLFSLSSLTVILSFTRENWDE